MKKRLLILCILALPVLASCKKPGRATDHPDGEKPADALAAIDACSLLNAEEIQSAQGSAVTAAKGTVSSSGGMRISQCYYATAEPNKSVSLVVTQSDPAKPNASAVDAYWQKIFGRFAVAEGKENESTEGATANRHEEDEGAPPKRIEGVGNEAFWLGNRMGGAFYAIDQRKAVFLRISLGGNASPEAKMEKSEALAKKALARIK